MVIEDALKVVLIDFYRNSLNLKNEKFGTAFLVNFESICIRIVEKNFEKDDKNPF